MITKVILLVFFFTGSPKAPIDMLPPQMYATEKQCDQAAKKYEGDEAIASAGCVEVKLPEKERAI
jgi:hypothetical protein